VERERRRFHWLMGLCLGAAVAVSAVAVGIEAHSSDQTLISEVDVARVPSPSRVLETRLSSTALGSEVPYIVYLPPGYDSQSGARYPVLYMLHSLGGDCRQWQANGLFAAADALIASGEIQPLIIVTPEGGRNYWVDHANNGPRWGTYITRDLVGEVDASYRTIRDRYARAIGGASMGGHGALQLAMNSNVFGVVGAHSVALRRQRDAFPFFGDPTYFEAHDPMSLYKQQSPRALQLVIWIDIGQDDMWMPAAKAFHEQLQAMSVLHEWQVNPGGHDANYWGAHLQEYLRFYSRALGGPTQAW
jgi:enterochelin esterase-like enzyme